MNNYIIFERKKQKYFKLFFKLVIYPLFFYRNVLEYNRNNVFWRLYDRG